MSRQSRGSQKPTINYRSSRNEPSGRVRSAGPSRRSGKSSLDEQKPKRTWIRTALIVVAVLVLMGGVAGAITYQQIKKTLPDLDIRNALGRDQSSRILDRNGHVLALIYAGENRSDIELAKMPMQLRQAVIATEDKRFYEHKGVDPIGILRAVVTDVIKRKNLQGGSTITQQYIKQAFVGPEKTLKRKLQEAIMATELDRRYSKDEILELYLNTIYFGHVSYGVQAASKTYFGKSVSDLNLEECATIAAVIKSPGLYSPYLDPAAALKRRNVVLKLMSEQNIITASEYQTAKVKPLVVKGLKSARTNAPYFVDWIKAQVVERFGSDTLYRGGITIKTTLDWEAQKSAEKAIREALNRGDDPSAALVSLNVETGEIIALVGGRDYNAQQYNVATQGKRQPGSAFKPFVLATAIEKGLSLDEVVPTKARSFKVSNGTWRVTGSDKGPMTIREATAQSVNSVYAKLILDVGPDAVVKTAHALGIESTIEEVPAIALGGLSKGVSPLEMANAYATLATGGNRVTPYGISEIVDQNGNVLLRNKPKIKKDVFSAAAAYLTTDTLRGTIQHGTGTKARIGVDAAGKTGTTQAYRDAWFVGYTPKIATAVWVGYTDGAIEMNNVHGIRVTGGSFPAQIWATFMKTVIDVENATRFMRPLDGLVSTKVCSESGLLPTKFCPKLSRTWLVTDATIKTCPIHLTAPVTPVDPTKQTTPTDGSTTPGGTTTDGGTTPPTDGTVPTQP